MKHTVTYFIVALLLLCAYSSYAQRPRLPGLPGNLSGIGGGGRSSGSGDSLQFEKRDPNEDSITLQFRYLDTARFNKFDSSLSDFFRRVPLKPEYVWLGNNGNAARSILFSPLMKPGWDAGFHAFDVYAFTLENTPFFNTTRPYTELGYLLGAKGEQQISILHTQNIKPYWNFGLQYRLINSPGFFNSQNASHSNYRFSTHYNSPGNRYNAFFVAMGNALQSSENGGIESDTFLINKNSAYNDRFNIPTNLVGDVSGSRNFFSVKLNSGNRYTNGKFLLRQQYDVGKKDSVVTDSTVIRFFYPTFRFEHTIKYQSYNFNYLNIYAVSDTLFYQQHYGITDVPDTVTYNDKWSELVNDLSIYQFPDPKNPLQFVKAGASFQNLSGKFSARNKKSNTLWVHGEYRNRTKNRKWDILAHGEFYLAGDYAGDYSALISLRRQLSKRLGSLELGFLNVNRTPSFVYDTLGSFPVIRNTELKKENHTRVYAVIEMPAQRLRLTCSYYLAGNYTYFKKFNEADQASVFNVLRIGLNKQFKLGKYWNWYLDVYFQTVTGNAPVNVPLIFTRSRLAFEGRFFKNLNLSTGFEFRYHTNYKADNYSPVLGQYFFQDQQTITNLPDLTAYMHFRIRTISAFIRLENLNTITFREGFGFKNNNLAAPLYPYPGMLFRLGLAWTFVN